MASIDDPCPASREKDLWARFEEQRDPRVREELVAYYLPVARRMARRYGGVSEPYDDLLQVASLGLLNAIDRFDVGRGTPFVGFAKPTIMGELKRYFRDKAWTIRVPRALHDRIAQIESATDELTDRIGRSPRPNEIATHLGIELDEVLGALQARQDRRPLGLEAPLGEDDDRSAAPEWLGEIDGGFELAEGRILLERILPGLSGRELDILRLRFVEDLPQSEIARRIGCSQMHVSRILRSTLIRLRGVAEGDEIGDLAGLSPARPHP